eukprot:TRINITY_DN9823_c0_g1_i1.p1 TRINITY_DN9823_c0_g1~~TRINITY_DN9823_c0_g1_i1.p1  ORF type:complete len:1554 (+),score=371.86 TRINITY_DN9823_c0_g1_i1:139-4662(+)
MAETMCHNRNARLCSVSELDLMPSGHPQNTACELDSNRIWTADTVLNGTACPNGGHVTRGATIAGGRRLAPQCDNKGQKRSVVCCGDRGLPETWQSELSCRELGWPIDNPNTDIAREAEQVCSASKLNVSTDFAYATTSRCITSNWYNAEASCAIVGARLCEDWELARNEAASPECGFDNKLVWAAGTCYDAHLARARVGNRDTASSLANGCYNKTSNFAVRCCADASVPDRPPKSAKTCKMLQAERAKQSADAKPRIPDFQISNAASSIAVCGASYGDCTGGNGRPVNDGEIENWAASNNYCTQLGARLCTYQELLADETADTGCSYNSRPIWTSSECRNGTMKGYLTHAGSSNDRFANTELEKRCRDPTAAEAFIRCCADIGVSCDNAGINGQCGPLNRAPCSTTADTCGACLPGFRSSDDSTAPSNADNCLDIQPPTIKNCPTEDVFITIENGLSATAYNYPTFEASDNDIVTRIVASPPSGSSFAIGTTKVTVTAFDNSSNTATCTFNVVVSGPSRCKAGFTRVDVNNQTSCIRCPAGSYVPAASNGPCDLYTCEEGTVDSDSNPATACTACDGITGYADVEGLTRCKPITTCPAGAYQAFAATDKADAVCLECPKDTYNPVAGGTCRPARDCSFGSEQTSPPTNTSNRVCTLCKAGTYKDVRGNDVKCQPVTATCAAGYEESSRPSITADRECSQCRAGFTKPAAGLTPCVKCKESCPAGQELTACRRDEPAECVPCASGTFSPDGLECKAATQRCGRDEYVLRNATSSSDIVCAPCTECSRGSYRLGGCDTVADRVCAPCPTQADCAANEFLQGVCNSDSVVPPSCQPCDVTCATCNGTDSNDCVTCPASLTRTVTADGVTCDNECDAGKYSDASNNCVNCDSSCATCKGPAASDCLTCPEGTALHDGQCVPGCPTGTWLDEQTSSCRACSECDGINFWAFEACSANKDTRCVPITTCDIRQYQTQPPSKTSDRVCRACDLCEAGFRRTQACQGSSNTQCERCEAGTFSTGLDNTICTKARECLSGYREVVAATSTSDRLCGECPAGTVGSLGVCTACNGTGLYVPPRSTGLCTTFTCPPGTVDHDEDITTSCKDCTGETYQDEKGQTQCKDWSVCPVGSIIRPGSGSGVSDQQCEFCNGISSYSDDVTAESCKPITPCRANEYEEAPPTSFRNRVCRAITTCIVGRTYQTVPPSPTSDRTCKIVSPPCEVGTTYQTLAPTFTSDRKCSVVTRCNIGVEGAPPTETTDRVCHVTVQISFPADASILDDPATSQSFEAGVRATLNGLKVDPDHIVSLTIRPGSIIAEVIISSEMLASDLISQVQQGLFKVRYSDGSGGGLQEVDGYDAKSQPAPSTGDKGDSGISTTTVIIIVLGALLGVSVLSFFVVMQRRKSDNSGTIVSGRRSNQKGPSAFSNPMYDTVKDGQDEDAYAPYNVDDDADAYERAVHGHSGYEPPTRDDDEAGYMDVKGAHTDPDLDDHETGYVDLNGGDDDFDEAGYMDM